MESATAWKVAGVGRETRVFAEEAARRAGLNPGEWLDEIIAERAAERGVDPADLRRDDRLDAIGERIAGLARRDDRFEDERRARPRLEPRWSRETPSPRESRRNDDLLEDALARLESRAERAEALQAAADRLATVEQRVERALEPRVRDLDARLDALARRVEHEPERRREPARPVERPRFDPKEAAAQIGRRRSELDARAASPDPAPRPRAEAAAPSNVEPLREEIAALTARLEKIRRDQAEQPAPVGMDVQSLRGELAAMAQSLANLAPRNAVVALEGAMRDLSERVAALGDGGAREALSALIVEARESLRAHDPHAAVAGLERELRTLGAKVDAIAQGVVDPAAFQRIRLQTEEVRNLLAAAASRPVPVERLERLIGELADRVDRLAASPAPQAESARVGALIADARAQIERSIPAAALTAIERRLEDLAQRMDAALRRPPQPAPIDPRALEDLTRRIDSLHGAVERQTDPAKLEAVLREIAQKLDRPAAAGGSLEPLTGMVRDLGQRLDQRVGPPLDIAPLEQALRALGDRPIEIDTAPIEAMMRDLGAKLVPAAAPDMRPFEDMLREISQKLDRGAPAVDLAAMIADLGRHIDERVGPSLNTRPLEEALMALRDRLENGPAEHFGVKFIEEVADLLAERLDRSAEAGPSAGGGVDADALAGQISVIHDRLDALQSSGPGAALERRIADLVDELDATRHAMQAASAPIGGGLADSFAELRAEQEDSDKRTQSRLANVQDILERMVGRLGRLEDDIARVDNGRAVAPAAAPLPLAAAAPPFAAPSLGAPPRFAEESFRAVGAASRELPERAVPAAPPRALDGADFLLEPGSTLPRPRAGESNDAAPPNSAINAHIAAARRAAHAALADEAAKPAEAAEVESENRIAAVGGQAIAFVAARRRPLLLGLALAAAMAMLAVIELRGGHLPLLQKSELSQPAAHVAASLTAAPTPKVSSTELDTTPTGAISPSASAAKAPPADLAAAIPSGLPQALHDGAAAGDVGAEFELALRLLDGRGVARDPHAAAQWFELTATRGLPIGQYRLAALYEKGIGVTRDLPSAMSWYVKAATAGNARAMHNLAVMHAEGSIGGKPDYATAAEWFRKAGEFGVRDSQFNLGILYARGLGVPQDLDQSWLWFSLAAQQGDSDAGHKRDDIAAKMDPAAVNAAAQSLGAFKVATPAAAANEAPAPAGGWDGKAAPQANAKPATAL